jgi:ATP-dependent Clp protease protease subunit
MTEQSERPEQVQYDTVCLVYHDEITIEKTKALMDICSNLVQQYSVKTIYFQFSSGGGSVDSAITLYNFLKSLPCEIVMHNTGSIDSAANVVFMAGDRRYAAAHTSFLFHGVGWEFGSNQQLKRAQIKETLSMIETAEDKIAGILADNTKLQETEIKALFTEGQSKSASFAKTKGVISELKNVTLPKDTPIVTVNTSTSG